MSVSDLIDVYTAAGSGGLEVTGNAFKIKEGGGGEAMLAQAIVAKLDRVVSLAAAASQPVSIGGTESGVTATINSSAVVGGGGLKVTGGAIELDTDNITVSWTATEI